jgi:nucleoside-diphosphate-sugar epimerase
MPQTGSKTKIYLSGHTGFLGSNLLNELKKNNSIDINLQNKKELNLLNKNHIKKFFTNNNIDILIHCAWLKNSKNMMQNKKNISWLRQSKFLIDYFFKNNGKFLVCIGSVEEYKKQKKFVYSENDPLKASNKYSQAKINLLKFIKKKYKNKFLWTRVFWLYGKNENNKRLIPQIINAKKLRKKLLIYHSKNKLDFLDIKIAVKIIYKLIFKKKKGVFNICSGQLIEISEICNYLDKSKELFRFNKQKKIIKIAGNNQKLFKNKIINKFNAKKKIFDYLSKSTS